MQGGILGRAEKLVFAINHKYHAHLVINTQKFHGKDGDVVAMRVVKDASTARDDYVNEELFKSASGVYTTLFLRDVLFSLEGKEIPDSDGGWKEFREKKHVDDAIMYMKERYGKLRDGE